ncbi:MAG TPA: hypothetical protein VGQ99_01325 [Tepidisphaeraceae bacterium]|jgi:hypothetical protein|nr:hypothetical protein [Tepidisphaeraceae bacterium]
MLKKTLPALLLGLTLTAGCETLGLGGDKDDSKDKTTTRDDRISHDRGTARDHTGYDMKYPADFDNGVPSGARLVRESDRQDISYKTPHDGKLYVYDVDSRRVVWSGFMRDGERFALDNRSGRATIEGQSVVNRDLNPDHRFRLYFVEGTRDSFNSDTDRYNDTSRDRDRSNDDIR